MSERVAQFLQGVGSVLTFGGGVIWIAKQPRYHDAEAFTGRSLVRDLTSVAYDLKVANQKRISECDAHVRKVESKK